MDLGQARQWKDPDEKWEKCQSSAKNRTSKPNEEGDSPSTQQNPTQKGVNINQLFSMTAKPLFNHMDVRTTSQFGKYIGPGI